jgi:predicted flavoprotein YhiN
MSLKEVNENEVKLLIKKKEEMEEIMDELTKGLKKAGISGPLVVKHSKLISKGQRRLPKK